MKKPTGIAVFLIAVQLAACMLAPGGQYSMHVFAAQTDQTDQTDPAGADTEAGQETGAAGAETGTGDETGSPEGAQADAGTSEGQPAEGSAAELVQTAGENTAPAESEETIAQEPGTVEQDPGEDIRLPEKPENRYNEEPFLEDAVTEEEPIFGDDFFVVEYEGEENLLEEEEEEGNWLITEEETADTATYRFVAARLKGSELGVFQYLTGQMGLSTAAACGVLANIYCESGFSTGAVGDRGTSYGLCQWHNGRKTSLLQYLERNGYLKTDLYGQLSYLQLELLGAYRHVYDYLVRVPNTADGAYQAARYFCIYFEIPKNRMNAGNIRGGIAKKTYWGAYADGVDAPSVLTRTETAAKAASNSAVKTDPAPQDDKSELIGARSIVRRSLLLDGHFATADITETAAEAEPAAASEESAALEEKLIRPRGFLRFWGNAPKN